MNKISTLFFIVTIFFWAAFLPFVVRAETAAEESCCGKDISEEEMEPLLIEAPSDAVLYSEDSDLDMPACDNARLIDAVLEKARGYFRNNPASDLLTKRRNALTLKYLDKFAEVDLKTLPRTENLELSDKLISYRINKGFKDKDFRICKSVETSQKPVYLLIYPENEAFVAEILNFAGPQPKGTIFGVIYD